MQTEKHKKKAIGSKLRGFAMKKNDNFVQNYFKKLVNLI